ncbi:MAG: AAA family ATPase [Planctomycetes bacterium]|nr:AAA family ATPase [Planctomycetota bacterium]
MSTVLRLAIVDPNDGARESLKTMLLGMDMVWLEAECSRYEFFADVVSQTQPDVGVVALDANPEKALALLENVREIAPACNLLVVSSSTDGQLILRAMRAGAKEYLNTPLGVEELIQALQRLGSQGLHGAARGRGCQVIAVAGSTGGVGTTSVCVNLGCILAKQPGKSVALVDLDLALGDADVFLDTIPDYTVVDVAQNITRLDFTLLKRSLTKHSSGLYLLPRPVQLQDTSLVAPTDLHRVLGLLKASFSHLILDLSKGYSELDMVALREAHHVLLITQLDLPCLRNVVRLLMSFDEIEEIKEKVKIVINRVGLESGQIGLKRAQETIGREVFWQIPNDYRVMAEVRNNGVPLIEHAPRSGIAQSYVSLAESLTGESSDEESDEAKSPSGRRWLNFWPAKTAKPAEQS